MSQRKESSGTVSLRRQMVVSGSGLLINKPLACCDQRIVQSASVAWCGRSAVGGGGVSVPDAPQLHTQPAWRAVQTTRSSEHLSWSMQERSLNTCSGTEPRARARSSPISKTFSPTDCTGTRERGAQSGAGHRCYGQFSSLTATDSATEVFPAS